MTKTIDSKLGLKDWAVIGVGATLLYAMDVAETINGVYKELKDLNNPLEIIFGGLLPEYHSDY